MPRSGRAGTAGSVGFPLDDKQAADIAGGFVRASTLAEDRAETLTLAKITHVPRQVATREATAPTDPSLAGRDH
jgi:hypothetical protein